MFSLGFVQHREQADFSLLQVTNGTPTSMSPQRAALVSVSAIRNTRSANNEMMLGERLRRWLNIDPALDKRAVLDGRLPATGSGTGTGHIYS